MSRDPGDATGSERDAELLTAYVDGVAELAPDERHRVSVRLTGHPQAQAQTQARAEQAAVRSLLDQLRTLPPEGAEPDWAAMERSIRDAVGRDVPRPWWRRWTWLAPPTVLATAAVVLVMWARPATMVAPVAEVRPVVHPASQDPRPADEVVALWLDGSEVDVDLSAADLLGDGDPGDPSDPGDGDPAQPDAGTERRLLPATNLAWVDGLDDDAIDRAEQWLAGEKG